VTGRGSTSQLDWSRLTSWLQSRSEPELRVKWDELEGILGGPLPPSKEYAAFWSNSSWHARAWNDAGFVTSRAGCERDEVRFQLRAGKDRSPDNEYQSKPVTPDPGPPAAARPDADVVLVGCVRDKRTAPAAAADLYTSPLFAARRRYAETSDAPWFILSAEYGLVGPGEWLSPYDRYLPDTPDWYRTAWGEWCAARLSLQGTLAGRVIEIHAGRAYAAALRPVLSRGGATVTVPLDALRIGEQLAWYANTRAGIGAELPSTALDHHRNTGRSGRDEDVVRALIDYRWGRVLT
jgi:hypothetical protein